MSIGTMDSAAAAARTHSAVPQEAGGGAVRDPIPARAPHAGRTAWAADPDHLRSLPAGQQPEWSDRGVLDRATAQLARMPALVEWAEVHQLRALLAEAAAGRLAIVQAGDCAEDPRECTPAHVARKSAPLASVMTLGGGKPVLRVGRIAGQFGKPRSQPTEQVEGRELPVFRGFTVNSPAPFAHPRRAQAERLLLGYRAAREASDALRRHRTEGGSTGAHVWTSHEALILDYELPLLRRDEAGRAMLGSTHWPWVGERTRQIGGAHVALLSAIANPVACKVGPGMRPGELLELCERLDPDREPGRLTLISRMGAELVASRLPALVRAVRAAGHPVIWLCDPMHGNTVTGPHGRKTRIVEHIVGEVRRFQFAVEQEGTAAGGLHLETTPDDVGECIADADRLRPPAAPYKSACDPRLNLQQAITVASAWGR
jgi:3-deoxy-7-phosphoheptulonate synthase